MRRASRVCWASLVACALAVAAPAATASRPELRGIDGLVRVYDDALDARYGQAPLDLRRACPPAPREACDVLAATVTWWRILLDPGSRALDAQFSEQVDRAIRSTDAWVARSPDAAEAHFYAGGAYAVRVQWLVLRGEKVVAARDGKHIRQELDRAATLDPDLADADFGIGLYEYYADVAPTAAKVLRFLFMLPGGDRVDGLQRMQRARDHGVLLQGEADYQLQIIDLWYEHRVDLAIGLLKSLHEKYPGNPLFLSDLADVNERYLHDVTAALDAWRELLDDAEAHRVNEASLAEAEARLGMARQLDALYQTDAALDQLRALISAEPPQPLGILARAYLALGKAEDRMGHRDAAMAAYRLAMAAAPTPDLQDVADRASARLKRAPDAAKAEAFRLSLEGWRRLEGGDAAGAHGLLVQSLALDPSDPVAHYREARALEALREDAAAVAQIEATLQRARDCPAPIAASAFLAAGRLYERAGQRDRAIADYERARGWFGGSAATRAAATRAITRLR
ncbi:MAG: hypothetical protein ACRD1V_11490 [Vicinamibacterales bacterium]